MLNENSTLASIAFVLGETLVQDYGVDPAPIFDASGIGCWRSFQPGERVLVKAMDEVWVRAVEVTEDPFLGLAAGSHVLPGHFYAFGHSFLASDTLLDAMRRLCRYHLIISTVIAQIHIQEQDDAYYVFETYPRPASIGRREAGDFGIAAMLKLCNIAVGRDVTPLSMEIVCDDPALREGYQARLHTNVSLTSDVTSLTFSKTDMESRISASIPEVAKATDRIADNYLETLDTSKVAAKVRQVLIDYLPSGKAHQDKVAGALHKSPSTLQRQLQSEGTSYREVLEDTRCTLARDYLEDGKYSHAHIAYLLGFSDQSNFSRAFKRWTGRGPRDYQQGLDGN